MRDANLVADRRSFLTDYARKIFIKRFLNTRTLLLSFYESERQVLMDSVRAEARRNAN
jgi:hypothetical protein